MLSYREFHKLQALLSYRKFHKLEAQTPVSPGVRCGWTAKTTPPLGWDTGGGKSASSQQTAKGRHRQRRDGGVRLQTMYPTIPLQDLKGRVGSLIREPFQKRNDIARDGQNHQCQWWLQLTKSQAVWVGGANRKPNSRWVQTFDADRICSFLDKLVDSTFITLGKVVLWQRIGIPMGTNCAPFLANLDCFSYELAFLRSLVRSQNAQQKGSREHTLIRRMHDASRYIDGGEFSGV